MDRKATARETLRILEQGYYLYGDQRISIEEAHEKSVKESVLITPEEAVILRKHGITKPILILGMFPGFMSMVAIYYILKGDRKSVV